MFGKRKQFGTQSTAQGARSEPELSGQRGSATAARRASAPAGQIRRTADQGAAKGQRGQAEAQGSAPQGSGTAPAGEPANEGRRLVVGRDIRLSGEIKKCDKLVVEGQVEASLTESRTLEISDTGLFRGDAVVEEAEVSGCFEGELTVNGRLHIRASGQVVGTVRYADIEIERGGRIAGSIDVMLPDANDELGQSSLAAPRADSAVADGAPVTDPEALPGEEAAGSGEADDRPDAPTATPAAATPAAAASDKPANGAGKPLPMKGRSQPDARG